MIKFVHPEVLYFLFLLIIPIIVHLFNFRRYKTLYFSNVRFLKDVHNRTNSQSRLQHLLVLFSRLLALAFLIFAFAQPYVPSKEKGQAGPKLISIYVDNSFSMDAENEDGNLFELARQYALILLEEFDEADRFFILSNEFSSNSVRPLQKEQAIEVLGDLEISPERRSLREVHDRQRIAMESLPEEEKMIFWISDFQRSNFLEELEIDSLIAYRLIPVQAGREQNLSLDSLWFTDPVRRPTALEELEFRIVNHAEEDAEAVQVRYMENGLTKASMAVDVPAGSMQTFQLSFTGPDSGHVSGVLEIDDYPVQFDDRLYMNYSIHTNRKVLLIHPDAGAAALRKLYSDAMFDLDVENMLSLDYSDLSSYDLIILEQSGPYGSGFIEQITHFIEGGGSFLVIPPSDPADIEACTDLCKEFQMPIYQPVQEGERRVGAIERESAFFRGVFKRIPEQMDLPKVNKHYPLRSDAMSYHRKLMQFDDGSAFWAYKRSGKGSIHLLSVPLDPEWSNWTAHALFPVIMFQLAYVTEQEPLYFTLGAQERLRFERPEDWLEDDLPLQLEGDGKTYTLSEHRVRNNEIEIFLGNLPERSGHYSLSKNGKDIKELSFNYSSLESDPAVRDTEDLEQWLQENGLSKDDLLTARADNIRAVLQGMSFSGGYWQWCILISLLFLLTEIVLLKALRP